MEVIRGDQCARAKISQYRGVSARKGKWIAKCNKQTLGSSGCEREAAAVWDKAVVERDGLDAQTNFPLKDYLDLLSAHPSVTLCLIGCNYLHAELSCGGFRVKCVDLLALGQAVL